MKLLPRNRRLLVERYDLSEESNDKLMDIGFAAPNETKRKKHDVLFKVLLVAPDVEKDLRVDIGDIILVEKGMADTDIVNGEEYITVLENYVKGVLFDER